MADIAIQIDTTAAPMAWELRVDEAVPGKDLARHCVGGPPPWIGTDVRFAQIDEMFRIVTLGSAQMLLHLKQYLDSGRPAPFFSF
jgi:hypothetical protein